MMKGKRKGEKEKKGRKERGEKREKNQKVKGRIMTKSDI